MERILRGGSRRLFFRLERSGERLILVRFPDLEELERYRLRLAYLSNHGMPVPEIREENLQRLELLVTDGGETSLGDVARAVDGEKRLTLYGEAVGLLVRLQEIPLDQKLPLFGSERVLKDLTYFEEMYLGFYGGSRVDYDEALKERLLRGFSRFENLKSLLYRDYQSENLLWREGVWTMIDFQDLFQGPALYDLASLLEDPYVDLPAQEVAHLKDRYFHASAVIGGALSEEEFQEGYALFASLRLLQCLGAYANLGFRQGKEWFQPYLQVAERRIAPLLKVI